MRKHSEEGPYEEFLRRNRAIARAADAILAGLSEFSNLRTRADFDQAVAAVRAEQGKDPKAEETVRELIERRMQAGKLDAAALRRYSLVCRAAEVATGQTPWHHQVATALLLNRGMIVQLPNGSGKTLAIALAAGFVALSGKNAHIATSNDYLAERDARSMGPLYQILGLSVGVIFTAQSVHYRRGLLDPDGVTLRVSSKGEGAPAAASFTPVPDAPAPALVETRPGSDLQSELPFEHQDLLRTQSDVIESLFGELEGGVDLKDKILEMIREEAARLIGTRCPEGHHESWDFQALRADLLRQFGLDLEFSEFPGGSQEEFTAFVFERLRRRYQEKEDVLGPDLMRQTERFIIRQVKDQEWKNYAGMVEQFALDIGIRPSGPEDPAAELRRNTQQLFDALWGRIGLETLRYLSFLQFKSEEEPVGTDSDDGAGEPTVTAGDSSAAPTSPEPVASQFDRGQSLLHETRLNYEVDESLTTRQVLESGIVYSRIDGFVFAYLRDHLAMTEGELTMTRRDSLIVDECDSVLVDDMEVPTTLTREKGQLTSSPGILETLHRIALRLNRGRDFILLGKSVRLTFEGLEALRRISRREFFAPDASGLARGIINALKANYAYRRDEDYVQIDQKIVPLEEASGRLLFGRSYNGGLQEALQVKEGLEIGAWRETEPVAQIATKHFVSIYLSVAGTSGAIGIPEEYRQFYGLETVEIDPHPKTRVDLADMVFRTLAEVVPYGVIPAAVEASKRGQAVLINVPKVKDIEAVAIALKAANVPFQMLDATTVRTLGDEAEKIKRAGTSGLVTISSKVAARGTDIVLDPAALKAGGLLVIGLHREMDRRYDDQLRGRAGRHGDPGSSLFVVSLEDGLLTFFGGTSIQSLMLKLGMEEGVPVHSAFVSKRISAAQHTIQRQNHARRFKAVELDNIPDRHRTVVYRVRQKILAKNNLSEEVHAMVENWASARRAAILKNGIARGWSNEGTSEILGPLGERLDRAELQRAAQVRDRKMQAKMIQEAVERKANAALNAIDARGTTEPRNGEALKRTILEKLDEHWCGYLRTEIVARDEISLYALDDPTAMLRYAETMEQSFDTFFYELGEEILCQILDWRAAETGVEKANA